MAGCDASPDIVAVVRADMATTAALPGTIKCVWDGDDPNTPKDVVAGYFCTQSFPPDPKRATGVGVIVKRAKGERPQPDAPFCGPGGSAFGDTRHGRYDVRAGLAMTGLLASQQPTLPQPNALLDRVLAAYDGAR